jgi:hypothetical protein
MQPLFAGMRSFFVLSFTEPALKRSLVWPRDGLAWIRIRYQELFLGGAADKRGLEAKIRSFSSYRRRLLPDLSRINSTPPYCLQKRLFWGELINKYAYEFIAAKDAKENKNAMKKEALMMKWIAAHARNQVLVHAEGVICRIIEWFRKRALYELEEGDTGDSHLFIPIPDREEEAKLAELGAGFQLPGPTPEELVECNSTTKDTRVVRWYRSSVATLWWFRNAEATRRFSD